MIVQYMGWCTWVHSFRGAKLERLNQEPKKQIKRKNNSKQIRETKRFAKQSVGIFLYFTVFGRILLQNDLEVYFHSLFVSLHFWLPSENPRKWPVKRAASQTYRMKRLLVAWKSETSCSQKSATSIRL